MEVCEGARRTKKNEVGGELSKSTSRRSAEVIQPVYGSNIKAVT